MINANATGIKHQLFFYFFWTFEINFIYSIPRIAFAIDDMVLMLYEIIVDVEVGSNQKNYWKWLPLKN